MKQVSIMSILIGITIIIISSLYSDGYIKLLGFLGSISDMEVVILKGKYIKTGYMEGHYEGRISYQFKHFLAAGSTLIIIGIGLLMYDKNKLTKNVKVKENSDNNPTDVDLIDNT